MRLLERFPHFLPVHTNLYPVIVDIQSAASWLLSESPQDYWDIADDMYRLTPPHYFTYMEYKAPAFVNRNGKNETTGVFSGKSICCVVTCYEIKEEKRITAQLDWALENYIAFTLKNEGDKVRDRIIKEAGWIEARRLGIENGICPAFILDAVIFCEAIPEPKPLVRCAMYLDSDGRAFGGVNKGTLMVMPYFDPTNIAGAMTMFLPFAFALSLMNCKNVVLDNDIRHVKRHEWRRMKREGRQFVTYKWLHIKQLQERVSKDMEREKRGSHNRLHFVRAHWATYTSDAPLFGKYEGTFFKPSHVRGKLSSGIALKGYKVDAP